MLQHALELHHRLMKARGIKYWDGPKGGSDPSDTVHRIFQALIKDFNISGRTLQNEMLSFPVEIEKGFREANESAAETIKIQAQAVLSELKQLIDQAAVLGFYYPASPLWQVQRKLRQVGKHRRGRAFWKSCCRQPFRESTIVDDESVELYCDDPGSAVDMNTDTVENPLSKGGPLPTPKKMRVPSQPMV